MSLNHLIVGSAQPKIDIQVERVISTQIVTEQIVPPIGGETCTENMCVEGNLNVECVDETKLNYKTPNQGTVGQFLTSDGVGGVEFTTQAPPDLSPLENKTQNIDEIATVAGVTQINGRTDTDELTFKANDNAVITLRPNDVGVSGHTLKSDGLGGVYFGPDEFNPSGLEYAGAGTAALNKVVKFNSNNGLSAVESKMTESATDTTIDNDNVNITATDSLDLTGGVASLTLSDIEAKIETELTDIVVNSVNNNIVFQNNSAPSLTVSDSEMKMYVPLNANTSKITNLNNGSDPLDGVNKSQLDAVETGASDRLDTLEQKTSTLSVSGFGGTLIADNTQITDRIGFASKLTHTSTDTTITNDNIGLVASSQITESIGVDDKISISSTDTNIFGGNVAITSLTGTAKLEASSIASLEGGNSVNMTVSGGQVVLNSDASTTTLTNSNIVLDAPTVSHTADSSFSGVLDMNLNKVIQVADGADGNDAVNRSQLDGVSGGANARLDSLEQKTAGLIVNAGVDTILTDATELKLTSNIINVDSVSDTNLRVGGFSKMVIGPTLNTSLQPIHMSSQRIQNLGDATMSGADAMNRNSVEGITDPLDTRLTTEEGKIITLEDKTACITHSGNGPNEETKIDCANIVLDTDHLIVQDTGGSGPLAKLTINDPAGQTPHQTIIQNTELEIDADKIVIRDTGDNPVNKIVIDGTTTALTDDVITATADSGILLASPAITLQGTTQIIAGSGNLDMSITNRIVNCADPVDNQDVANKQWVLANAGGSAPSFVELSNGAFSTVTILDNDWQTIPMFGIGPNSGAGNRPITASLDTNNTLSGLSTYRFLGTNIGEIYEVIATFRIVNASSTHRVNIRLASTAGINNTQPFTSPNIQSTAGEDEYVFNINYLVFANVVNAQWWFEAQGFPGGGDVSANITTTIIFKKIN